MRPMKSSFFGTSVLLAWGAAAQVGSYTEITEIFRLKIQSANESISDQYLYPAHVAAAEEIIRASPDASADFYVASKPDAPTLASSVDPVGVLAWNLPSNPFPGHSATVFVEQPTGSGIDFAFVTIGIDEEMQPQPLLGFDRENHMFAYVAGETEEDTNLYYEWFLCSWEPSGPSGTALAWVHGKAASPDKCTEVTVVKGQY